MKPFLIFLFFCFIFQSSIYAAEEGNEIFGEQGEVSEEEDPNSNENPPQKESYFEELNRRFNPANTEKIKKACHQRWGINIDLSFRSFPPLFKYAADPKDKTYDSMHPDKRAAFLSILRNQRRIWCENGRFSLSYNFRESLKKDSGLHETIGYFILQRATEEKDAEVFKACFPIVEDDEKERILFHVVESGNILILKICLEELKVSPEMTKGKSLSRKRHLSVRGLPRLLHCAVMNEQIEVVRYLLQRGAKSYIHDKGGQTAWELAQHSSNPEMKRLFQGKLKNR